LRTDIKEIPDFTRPTWHRGRSDARLVATILEGRGAFMPAFGDRLTREQAHKLVVFIRSFDPMPAPEAAEPSAADFETQFRQLETELAELRRQFRELTPAPSKP
jgi:mono/diheme cytochrome c family protein